MKDSLEGKEFILVHSPRVDAAPHGREDMSGRTHSQPELRMQGDHLSSEHRKQRKRENRNAHPQGLPPVSFTS